MNFKHHRKAMNEAQDMQALALIALDMLDMLSEGKRRNVAQVCGPISTGGFGTVEKNLVVFRLSIKILERRNLNVFDQTVFQDAITRITEHNPENTAYKMEILDDFFDTIFRAGYISAGYFVPNWHTSKGSKWEHKLLCALNIPRVEMKEDWFPGIVFAR